MTKRIFFVVCTLFVFFSLSACSSSAPAEAGHIFLDALGNEVHVSTTNRVVALMGSYAETWLLSGGTLVGVTDDAISERGLDIGDAQIVGSVKNPNLEEIISCTPDFVILSADIAGHLELRDQLANMQIPAAYFKVDQFSDYLAMLKVCTDLTGEKDAYITYGANVQNEITAAKALSEGKTPPSVLLIRAFSTGAKAKGTDTIAGAILEELGTQNICSRYESLLEDLSIEEIILADPDCIFITTMGDETDALSALESGIMANPAWSGLTAVKSGRVHVLPKELFHYKPNARWGESYQYLADLIYE